MKLQGTLTAKEVYTILVKTNVRRGCWSSLVHAGLP